MKDAREEYIKQFVSRTVMPASPIPGVSIDVNDVGLVGGVALTLLLLVQALCVMRENENLFLALYKVRKLHENEPRTKARGNTDANLLYHALAMSQVLSSPPTLARWEDRSTLSHLYLIFYLPAVAYTWIVIDNTISIQRGALYGAAILRLMILQYTMLIMLFILSTICLLNSRAMSGRWLRTFYAINPQLRHFEQPSERWWLKYPAQRLGTPAEETRRDLAHQVILRVVDSLHVTEAKSETSVEVSLPARSVDSTRITPQKLRDIARDLIAEGVRRADEWCASRKSRCKALTRFEPGENILAGGQWEVGGTWYFTYEPVPTPESRPSDV